MNWSRVDRVHQCVSCVFRCALSLLLRALLLCVCCVGRWMAEFEIDRETNGSIEEASFHALHESLLSE